MKWYFHASGHGKGVAVSFHSLVALFIECSATESRLQCKL
jgi:hypothetical protein